MIAVETDFPQLSPAQRASRPAERRGIRRDQVKLLIIDREAKAVRHSRFDRLGDLLCPGDLLVVNTSRVLPAGVRAARASGQVIQLRPCVRRAGFQDDAFDAEHHLFEGWFEVSPETAQAVNSARRVVAVGTTVVRALESAATWEGRILPARDWTRLGIGPQRPPRAVDALITGLHEPQASHFELLRAFVREPLLRRAYSEAVERGYLWHEFGDSALII